MLSSDERWPPARVVGGVAHEVVEVDEVALDGALRPVRGVLDGVEVVAASLRDCIAYLRGERTPDAPEPLGARRDEPAADLAEVRGHAVAKQALEIAAAGGTTCCWSARRVRARRCWRAACPASCRRCRRPRRSTSRACTRSPGCSRRAGAS